MVKLIILEKLYNVIKMFKFKMKGKKNDFIKKKLFQFL